MGKPRKDGQRFNMVMDRSLYNRLTFYADEKGQTMTLAIERILKQHLDEAGVPEDVLQIGFICFPNHACSFPDKGLTLPAVTGPECMRKRALSST